MKIKVTSRVVYILPTHHAKGKSQCVVTDSHDFVFDLSNNINYTRSKGLREERN
jgi:hypothetical protein